MKTIVLPVTVSQNDPRWKGSPLGTKGTIGLYGCLENDATMVANYYGKTETPLTLNDKLTKNGGYANGNQFVWAVFAKLYGLKYSGQWSNQNQLTQDQMNAIRAAIAKGYPVFLQIDTVPTTSALDEHWILATGWDDNSPDDLIVQDPWDGAKKRITTWGVTPQKLIYAWCWFEGDIPTEQQPAEGCLVPNTLEWRTKYQNLVNASDVRREVAQYLQIPNPDNASTQTFKNVIGGIKSTQTTLQQTVDEQKIALASAQQEVLNREEQVGRLKVDVLNGQGREKALLDQTDLLTVQIKDEAKAKGQALNKLAEVTAQLDACKKGLPPTRSLWDAIWEFLHNTKTT
jgi:hypothetical protein